MSNLEQAQISDPVCLMIIKYSREEWPGKTKLSEVTLPYWEARSQLTFTGNLLLQGRRLIIPVPRQQETLAKLHAGHQWDSSAPSPYHWVKQKQYHEEVEYVGTGPVMREV